ncbi:MAG: translation initiation factor IF-2 [Oscillospiraceae bacterium]|jgi:translation initiation factor IF-2
MMIKYRVHEVAKDLNVPSKDIITLLGKHFDTPKKHMTALTEEELNVVFEHFTQKNQVESFDAYFASGKKEEVDEKEQPKEEKNPVSAEKQEPVSAQPQQNKKPEGQKPGQQNVRHPQSGRPAGQQNRPHPQTGNTPAATVSESGSTGTRGRHVDMRTSQVNLDKYNEKYDNIATSSIGNKDTGVKKQKLTQRSAQRGRPQFSRKDKEAQKMRRLEMERQRRQKLEITIPDEIQVGELAARLKVTAAEVIKRLMALGVMASVTEVIDYDTAAMVAMEIGAKVEKEVILTIEDRLIDDSEDNDENLQERSPVVVVMGHVDHGKTSLLDAIRHANVTSTEAGGITQHIGAYRVMVNDRPITFLDTPGHEAFTSMRARGAQVTDIAILVVAADDGIMPQTVEAINHAKAAGVSIIVAINKMDKDTANPDKVKQELTEYELVPEEWGGDVICVPVSAVTKQGIDTLLEMVQLVADMKELKANPDRLAKGTVIEAKLDKGRGPVATVLVQNGTLHTGDVIIAGTALGRVRVMLDDHGQQVEEAGPSVPVEITGLAEVPSAGDTFNAVEDERLARELVEQRRHEQKEEVFKSYQKVTLDNLFSQIAEGEMKELPIIVKADVMGSVEAVRQSLEKISNDEVRVRVIHGAVGAVSESDVMLAEASNAIIVGFNVRPDPVAKENAEQSGVEVRLYRIIYDAIEDVTAAMKGMLAPKFKDVDLGRAEIRQVYKITGVGVVAGCYVLEGKIARNANIRVVRDGIIVADDKLSSLKRFKDDVREVASGYECGMTMEKFNDIKEGDILEAYVVEEYRED